MELNSKENPIHYFLFWLPQDLFKRKDDPFPPASRQRLRSMFWPGCPLWQRHESTPVSLQLLCCITCWPCFWNGGLLEASSIVACCPTSLQPLVPLQRHNILQTACLFMLVFKNKAKIKSLFSWLGTQRDSLRLCCFLAAPNQITGMSVTFFNLNIKIIYAYFPGTFHH